MKIDGSRKSRIYCDYGKTYIEGYLSGDIYPEDAETYEVPIYSNSESSSFVMGYEERIFEDPIRVQCFKQDEYKGTIMFEGVSIPIWFEEDSDKEIKEKEISAYRGAATTREYYETINEVERVIYKPVKLFVGTEDNFVSLYTMWSMQFTLQVVKNDKNMLMLDVIKRDDYFDKVYTISLTIDLEEKVIKY